MKVKFNRVDKDTRKIIDAEDPLAEKGGWLNVPMEEKDYTIIDEFIPICGDTGRVLYNENMKDDCFAIEIFCKNVFSEIIFCDSYQEVCGELCSIFLQRPE